MEVYVQYILLVNSAHVYLRYTPNELFKSCFTLCHCVSTTKGSVSIMYVNFLFQNAVSSTSFHGIESPGNCE